MSLYKCTVNNDKYLSISDKDLQQLFLNTYHISHETALFLSSFFASARKGEKMSIKTGSLHKTLEINIQKL